MKDRKALKGQWNEATFDLLKRNLTHQPWNIGCVECDAALKKAGKPKSVPGWLMKGIPLQRRYYDPAGRIAARLSEIEADIKRRYGAGHLIP